MKSVQTKALVLALGVGVMTTVAIAPALAAKKDQAAPAASGPTYTPAVRNAAVAAQTAQKAGDTATALAKINEAKAAAQTDDDRYLAASLLFDLARTTNDQTQLSQAIDAIVASGKAPADRLPLLLVAQGQFAYNAHDYRKAQTSLEQAIKLQPQKPEIYILLAQIRNQNGDKAGALTAAQQAVDMQKQAGQPVPSDWYQRALAIAYEGKLAPEAEKWSEALVAAYPTAENWRNVIEIYRQTVKLDDQQALDIMRLKRAVGALKGERDYYEYSNLALNRGLPGEAKAVIDEGIAANMVPAGSKPLGDVKATAASKVTADRASLPGAETRARSAADGKLALSTADAYLGYGDWAKAADLYKLALSKGGVDAATADTRLGIALARSGDKAGALAAFGQVTGPRQQIAHFWTLYLNQKA